MSKLIIIRGNSGSGKSTVAKELQRKLGRNTMLISQDYIRREMLCVLDKRNNKSVPLIIELLKYGKRNSPIIILEGILYSNYYESLFEAAKAVFGSEIYAYYYDIPFEETLLRHKTKTNCSDFGEKELKNWWRDKDFLEVIPEKKINELRSKSDTVAMIIKDISD